MTDFACKTNYIIKYDIQNYRANQISTSQQQTSTSCTDSTFLRTRSEVCTEKVLTKGFHQLWKKYTLQHR